MEKLLRRSLLNRNQLVAKKHKESVKEVRRVWREYNRLKNTKDNELNRLIKNERLSRREDWIRGPLAPRRDIGKDKETYGAVENLFGQGLQLPKGERKGPSGKGEDSAGSEDRRIPGFEDGEWKGEGLLGNLAIGDRVVVIKGHPSIKGKIGEVSRVDNETATVSVKDVNKVDMVVPPQAQVEGRKEYIFEQEIPIPISDVRLVTTLTDTETGIEKDVIVRQIYGAGPYEQKSAGSNLPRHTRYIKGTAFTLGEGTDVVIPWPKEDPDRYFAQSVDTSRKEVEEQTYIPWMEETYLAPKSVIDELREKHSRARRDWDDVEFLQKKMLQDARKDWFAERSKVLSEPFWTKEFLARQKREKGSESNGRLRQ